MYNQQVNIIAKTLMLFDASIIVGSGYTAYYFSLVYRHANLLVMSSYQVLGSILCILFINNYLMDRFGLYAEKRFASYWALIQPIIIVVACEFIGFFAGFFFIDMELESKFFAFLFFTMIFTGMLLIRIFLYVYINKRSHKKLYSYNILIAGSSERIKGVASALRRQISWGHTIAGYICTDNGKLKSDNSGLPLLGRGDDFKQILFEYHIDEVIFAFPGDPSMDIKQYLNKCDLIGVAYKIVPAFFDPERPNALAVEMLQNIPVLSSNKNAFNVSGLLYKRILDIATGLTGTILFLIIYPFAALAIKLDSPGPVLFKQCRIGMHGRKFYIRKFRTMVADAESQKAGLLVNAKTAWPELKTGSDPRITKIGAFLRKTSLDEFPQFINVLKGDMSLIGTRPPTPSEVEVYEDWHRKRISIKPGLTGLWQVSGRKNVTDFAKVVQLDIAYIDGWKFWRDISILWKTALIVFSGKGAK